MLPTDVYVLPAMNFECSSMTFIVALEGVPSESKASGWNLHPNREPVVAPCVGGRLATLLARLATFRLSAASATACGDLAPSFTMSWRNGDVTVTSKAVGSSGPRVAGLARGYTRMSAGRDVESRH